MKFNDWILSQLRARNWSQADLAREANLTRGAISKYMIDRIPDESALRKIAKAFKLSPEYVFEKAGLLPPKSTDPIIAEIAHLASQLPPEDAKT